MTNLPLLHSTSYTDASRLDTATVTRWSPVGVNIIFFPKLQKMAGNTIT